MKKISIIVPCYNEEETINTYYNEAIKYLNEDINWHFIFVNDGSKDKTLLILKELAEKDKRVLYVSFSRNFGKEAAMYAGLEAAKKINADAAIIMDVDLQDPPHLIPDLVKAHDEGYNLIYTKHKNRKGANPLITFLSLSFYKIYAFVTKDKEMAKGARDFCLLDKKAIDAFLQIKDNRRFTKGIYHYVGFRKKCIEFEYEPRVAGTTKWGIKKLFNYAMIGMREFSRLYEYIPKILSILVFFLLCYDTGYQIYNCIENNASFNWQIIRMDLIIFAIFITLFYLFKLTYDVKDAVKRRPIYIEEDSNINDAE
ncbi:MAG: glycosyltransferase family 2 protein [Anaeroplasma sp.]